MKTKMLTMLITTLMGMLSPELLKKFADLILDFIEDTVAKSPNKYDDLIILPTCALVRNTFGVSDTDEPKIDTNPVE